jgi:(p)ppGpp synthase/HD superfamily hydrolase
MLLYNKALIFAVKAHGKQLRKYTGDPYIIHPIAVADLVERALVGQLSSFGLKEVKAAAVLHDVLEDTDATYADLLITFGPTVANLVGQVTDVSKSSDGNRAARKEIDRQHLAKSSYLGASIKLADLIDNTSSIVEHDKDFARVYLKEKAELLKVLSHGNKALLAEARRVSDEAARALKS